MNFVDRMKKFGRTFRNVKKRDYIFPVFIWILMIIWCAVLCFILAWGIGNSLRTQDQYLFEPSQLFSFPLDFENYELAINNLSIHYYDAQGRLQFYELPELLYNTFIYAIGTPLVSLTLIAITSYVVVRYGKMFRWVGFAFTLVIFCNYFTVSGGLAAQLIFLRRLGIYDNLWGILFWNSGGFGGRFFLYYAAWKSVPQDYADAAMLDGAGHFQAYLTIMFPMTLGLFWTFFLSMFISLWNDFDFTIFYMPTHPTVSYAAWQIENSMKPVFYETPVRLAGIVITVVPVLILFIIFNDKLLNPDIRIGGLKG